MKAYAVTGAKRSPMLPDVPTTAEAGMPEFNLLVWFGLSAPKGTPQPVIEKLNKALAAALDDPEVVKRFAELGFDGLDHVVQLGEVAIVQAAAAGKLPNTFDWVEFWAIERQIVQNEICGVLGAPFAAHRFGGSWPGA